MPVELKPSSAGKWVNCTGSPFMEMGRPEGDTSAADEGTVAHWIAAKILRGESIPEFDTDWEVVDKIVFPYLEGSVRPKVTFTREMLDYVLQYTDVVQLDKIVDVETSVNLEYLLGYPGAKGTPDAVTGVYNEADGVQYIMVHDLKYGYNEVHAKDNLQLMCYAHGVFHAVQHTIPVDVEILFELVIHQPRLDRVVRATYALEDIQKHWTRIAAKAAMIQEAAARGISDGVILSCNPGEHCHKFYCKARAICPELQKSASKVLSSIVAELPDLAPVDIAPLDTIGSKLAALPMVRAWCDAIEAEAERLALVEGKPIDGFKVVEGRRGRREWGSETEAEEMLKRMAIKHEHMYKYSVISPTQAEKLAKEGVIGPRQWPKLQDLIDRKPAKLCLVPDTDKRPPVEVTADVELLDDFSDLIGA